jgi:glycosyltransferase involved in cell wall biosynthesis
MKITPLFSVIVTTFNSEFFINECLISIFKQTYKEIEIIVVDNNSKDRTVEISKNYTNKIFNIGPERSAQRNYGASKSNGEFLLIVDSDMILSTTVVEDLALKFIGNPEYKALVIPEESFGVGFWSSCKKLERSFYIGIPWMEAARAFRKLDFHNVGGYDEENTGTEDYDLPHRIEAIYGRKAINRIDSFIYHNEGNLKLLNSCKKKFYYARNLDVYTRKKENSNYFLKQANPFYRFFLLLNNPLVLLKNPILSIGMLYLKFCELISGAFGYILRKKNIQLKNSLYK